MQGLADGGGDDVELPLNRLGDGLRIGGDIVGILLDIDRHGGELGGVRSVGGAGGKGEVLTTKSTKSLSSRAMANSSS